MYLFWHSLSKLNVYICMHLFVCTYVDVHIYKNIISFVLGTMPKLAILDVSRNNLVHLPFSLGFSNSIGKYLLYEFIAFMCINRSSPLAVIINIVTIPTIM
jgi:Leucine-rich repeat (LRR) protein